MVYNPFRKIYTNWHAVLYAESYADWFNCCINLLAGDYFDNPTNATLGFLDYLFILPALIKIAEFYSQEYFALKKSLSMVSSILTIGTLLISGLVAVAMTPLLYLARIPFAKEAQQRREEEKNISALSKLTLLPLTENNKRYVYVVREQHSEFSYIQTKHLDSDFFSQPLEEAFPEIIQAIRRGEKLRLYISHTRVEHRDNYHACSNILALWKEDEGDVAISGGGILLAFIERNEKTSDGLRAMKSLCNFFVANQDRQADFPTCIFSSERSNSKKREKQSSNRIILKNLALHFPIQVSNIVIEYAQLLDIKGYPQGIGEDIYQTIAIKSEQLGIVLPENFDDYTCSIGYQMIFDPVIDPSCNHYRYERTLIETWRDQHQWREEQAEKNEINVTPCPCCRKPITHLVENQKLKKEITEFLTRVYLKLEQDIYDDPSNENNISRRQISTMSQNFLKYGNSERVLQEKYDEFLADERARSRSSTADDIHHYKGYEISCGMR